MTDKEMLERAAEAAFPGEWEWNGVNQRIEILQPSGFYKKWVPLDDDGDALRLAVKKGIHIIPTAGATAALGWRNTQERDADNGGDEYAAARRAIVRAAAEIKDAQGPTDT